MSVMLIFLAVIAVIVLWWMTQHRLTSKPWLEVGLVTESAGRRAVADRAGQGRARHFPRRRWRALCASDQRLLHAHGGSRLVGDAHSPAALGQHRRACAQQRRARMGKGRGTPRP